eukprot:1134534-Pelagomonas_calceolata.AAC.1
MPREKGPEWGYVTLEQHEGTDGVKQVKNKCKLCEHVFHGGATRIRLHFLQVPGCGVAKCTAAEDKLGRAKKVMQQLEQDSRKKEQQEAQERQFDRAPAPAAVAAAPVKKRKTPADYVPKSLLNNLH